MQSEEYYYEVFLNGAATNLIARFMTDDDGQLWANAQELENVGISSNGIAPNATGDVPVAQIPSIVIDINHAEQTIAFGVADSALAARVIDAQATVDPFLPQAEVEEEELVAHPTSGTGIVMNYNVGSELLHSNSIVDSQVITTGSFDLRAFIPIGVLNHSFSLSSSDVYSGGYRRRDTHWRTTLPGAAIQFQLGDLITRGPNWANPVRLGGIQLRRNFALRPDMITMPLPTYRGTAAVPSTVEVFDNNIRRLITDVPQGPFEFRNLPFAAGVNTANIVIRDAAGTATVEQVTFLATPRLLRSGLADFSMSIGYPRIGIGTENDQYADEPVGAFSYRRGLTDWLTIGAYVEFGDELKMFGFDTTTKVGEFAIIDLAAAQSRTENGVGRLMDFNATADLKSFRLGARVMRSDEIFTDIARLTTETTPDIFGDFVAITDLKQMTLSFDIPWNSSVVQFLYADTTRIDGSRDGNFGISGSMQLGKRSTLNASGFMRFGDSDDMFASLSAYVPFGKEVSTGVEARYRNGTSELGLSVSKVAVVDNRDWNWRLETALQSRAFVAAYASREFPKGRLEGAFRGSADDVQIGIRAEGAVVLSGGGLFTTKRVNDAFAVVDAGAPNVEVSVSNRPVGATNRSGKILVTELTSNTMNEIAINVADLPTAALIGDSVKTVIPAAQSGQTIRFDVDTTPDSAIVYLYMPSGIPAEVGQSVRLERTGEAFVIGYDGMVFLDGLAGSNTIMLTQPNGIQCRATFNYIPQPDTVTDLGQVICS